VYTCNWVHDFRRGDQYTNNSGGIMSRAFLEISKDQPEIQPSVLKMALHRVYLRAILGKLTPKAQVELFEQLQGQMPDQQLKILADVQHHLAA
jgi:hypothetical protein